MTTDPKAPGKQPDVLVKPVPALSSTSDMPAVAPPPDDAAKAATDKAAADKAAADKAAADKAAEGKTGDDKTGEKGKVGINERFSKMAAERRAAEERAAAAEKARQDAEAKYDAIAADVKKLTEMVGKAIPQVDDDPKPERAKFDDPARYDEALAAWGQRQGEKKGRLEAENDFKTKTEAEKKKAAEESAKAEAERAAKQWSERAAAFEKDNPDFLEVVNNDQVPVTPVMAQAMAHSELGPKIAYHLGKNPEIAAKIAAMQPMQQLMEIGKLEVSLNVPPKTTTTPPPIEPISGSRADAGDGAREPSMSEYAEKRNKALADERAASRPARR